MRLSNSYQETRHILIAIIILTIVFSFNDKTDVFNPEHYSINFILTLVIVAFSILVHLLVLKLISSHYGVFSEFTLWSFEEVANINPIKWRKIKKGFRFIYSGSLFAFLLTLVSNGKAYLTAISTFKIENTKTTGRQFPNITEKEMANMAFLIILAHFILALIFRFINVKQGVLINSWIMVWNLLPVSSLLGSKIFFGSRTLYIFTLVLAIISLGLIGILTAMQTLLISIFAASIMAGIWFWKLEYIK